MPPLVLQGSKKPGINRVNTDIKVIGFRFSIGPFFFLGFCNAVIIPRISSFGKIPVETVLLNICEISSQKISGPIFKSSALTLSIPVLLLFFRDMIACLISLVVKGISITVGFSTELFQGLF